MAPDSSKIPLDTAPTAASPARRRRPTDRYSRFVNLMKYVLPGAAAILLGAVLIWPLFQGSTDDANGRGEAALEEGPIRNFEMSNPRYVGTDEKGRPFELTAEAARQQSLEANEVTLVKPRARVTLESGNLLFVRAQNGEFRQAERVLVLSGDVNFFHDSGYTFKTEYALLDMANSTARGDRPVIATGPKGTLEAQGFRIRDKGKTILFTGRSRVKLNLTEGDIGDIAGRPGKSGQ